MKFTLTAAALAIFTGACCASEKLVSEVPDAGGTGAGDSCCVGLTCTPGPCGPPGSAASGSSTQGATGGTSSNASSTGASASGGEGTSGGVSSGGTSGASTPANGSSGSAGTTSTGSASTGSASGGSTGSSGGSCAQSKVALSSGSSTMPVLADVNGDGDVDLLVPENGNTHMQVFLGDGKGGFGAGQTFLEGASNASAAFQLAVADFNGDGKPDVAAGNYLDGNVSILLGNGDGTFQKAVQFPSGVASSDLFLTVADVNGDHRQDVITSNGSGSVSVLLGNGDGTLQKASLVALLSGSGGGPVFGADLRGSGRVDLIVACFYTGALAVLLGNGDGTFAAPQALAVGNDASWAAAGDFFGDGKLDLVVAAYDTQEVQLLRGNGDGTFQAPSVAVPSQGPPGSETTAFVASFDVNADGALDLVVTFGNSIYTYLGNGQGGFAPSVQTAQAPFLVSSAGDVGSVAVAYARAGGPLLYASGNGSNQDVGLFSGECF